MLRENGKSITCDECDFKQFCNIEVGSPICENCKFEDINKNYDTCTKCIAIAMKGVCMFSPKE